MIIDLLLATSALVAIIVGFRRGFLHTVFTSIGYVGGGVLGLYLALRLVAAFQSPVYKFIAIIIAIFITAEIGRRIMGLASKLIRTKILWTPLRVIDSLAGVLLEFLRVFVVGYLITSAIMWSPWTTARKAVEDSVIYPKINQEMPEVLTKLQTEIKKKLTINLPT